MSDIQSPTVTFKAIGEATPAELRNHAILSGLDISDTASDDEVLATIKASQPGIAAILVMTEAPAIQEQELAPEEQSGRMAGSLGRGDPRAVIFIPNVETDDNTGSADIFVGVNGKGWQLKRGVDLPVPWRVVEALGLTLQDIIRHDEEGNVIKTSAMRFPVQMMKRPSIEQIEEWHRRTDDQFCP